MAFKYSLREYSNNPNKAQILVLFSFDGDRLRWSPKITINPIFWNKAKQRVKKHSQGKKLDEALEINARLNQIEIDVNKIFQRLKREHGKINKQIFKLALDEELKGLAPEKEKKLTLFEFYEKVYLPNTLRSLALGTYKSHKTTFNQLVEFGELWRPLNPKFDFDDITLDFYHEYTDYMKTVRKLAPNTIAKRIGCLKAMMSEAKERGLHSNDSFMSKRFSAKREEVQNIYLDENEIEAIYKLDVSHLSKGYQTAKDLFLIGCNTGLRYSDFTRLKSANIRDGKIFIRTQKTKQDVVIPFRPMTKAILKKYKYKLPKPLVSQPMNRYIKKLGKMAGITTPIQKTKTKGNLTTEVVKPKCEMITSHTARRSFATNAYLAGIDVLSIRLITGHKDDRSFYRYIKVSAEQNADLLKENAFFKGEKTTKLKAV